MTFSPERCTLYFHSCFRLFPALAPLVGCGCLGMGVIGVGEGSGGCALRSGHRPPPPNTETTQTRTHAQNQKRTRGGIRGGNSRSRSPAPPPVPLGEPCGMGGNALPPSPPEEETEDARSRGEASGVVLPMELPPPQDWSMPPGCCCGWPCGGMDTLRPGPSASEEATVEAGEGCGGGCESEEAPRRKEAESGEGACSVDGRGNE